MSMGEAESRVRANDPRLTHLDLSSVYFEDKTLEGLADALGNNTLLEGLNLANSALISEGIRRLAVALRGPTPLKVLKLQGNDFGIEGARYLADALRDDTVLELLDVYGCDLENEGAGLLADALQVNTALKELNLGDNNIGAEGAGRLGDALKVNTTLEALKLADNNIADEAASRLAAGLKTNTVLNLLKLKRNPLGRPWKKHLEAIIKERGERAAVAEEERKQEEEAEKKRQEEEAERQRQEEAAKALRQEQEAGQRRAADVQAASVSTSENCPKPAASIPACRAGVSSGISNESSSKAAADAVPQPAALNPSASSSLPSPAQSCAAFGMAEGAPSVAGSAREISFEAVEKGAEIGRGGLGVVYSGRWGHEEVAVKEAMGLAGSDVAQLVQEAEAMQQLHSPHVVTLYGVALREVAGQSSTAMLVMELMRGGSLHALLHNGEPLPWSRRLQIVKDVAKGLRYMHQVDFLHRDVKSGNVLLDEYGRPKVADFGFSQLKHSLSLQSTRHQSAGTPVWMAPELFKRRAKFTPACDVYSFGMLMWEVAARAVPFADAHSPEVAIKWIEEGEKEDIPEDTPPAYAELLQRCWSSDAAARPSMAEAVDALEAVHV
eukprot:TRINITY_DN315_c0_g1_i13.p1 TRINITY_DN315_c0_g1~~TRINITY_DN315_c0_g1_i13.p1  ORF type:complete len:610 (+),score=128.03 TRINITY_DN315_c0_g1_i13:786-2615(+)